MPKSTVCSVVSNSVSPPDFSVHGIFQAKNIVVGGHFLLQKIFPIQASNPHLLHLLHWQVDSLPLCQPRKPRPILVDKNLHFTFILICLFPKSLKLAYSCSFSVLILDFNFFCFSRIPLIFQY